MARRDEHLAQLEMVVDLAVLHDPDRRVLVVNGLVAALDVDDREAAHAEGHSVAVDAPVLIGAPVHHRGAHASHHLAPLVRLTAGNPTDPTHLFARSGRSPVRGLYPFRPPLGPPRLRRGRGRVTLAAFEHLSHDIYGLALRLVIGAYGKLVQ